MNPASIALKNNRTTLVIYVLLLLVGLSTYFSIGRLEYPEFTIRNAQIMTSYPGRSSVEVEQQVSDPLERAIRQMPEVKEITSTSKPGISILSVELEEDYFDLDPIWQDMRNKVSAVELPDGAKSPQINDEVGDVFPYVYALTSDGFTPKEMLDHAEDIRDRLLELDGVAKVEFHGDIEERVFLEFSSSEIAAYNVSPTQISQQLSAQNTVASSGTVLAGQERLDLITLGEFDSLQEIADYRLSTGGANTVRVSDVVDVKRSYIDPPSSISHYNGERALCIAISMVEGQDVTKVGAEIEARMEQLQATLPIGLDIETMFYQPIYVSKSIKDFIVNLGQAFAFVVIVMFLFAGLRIALIVGILVPSAILITFVFMPTFDVQLEMMSIAALIIALGLLVDNAVVVTEQILVRQSQGMDRLKAVTESVSNLLIPLLAASGTTIAAFSTIALSPGATSEFTYSLFAVITLTLLASWGLSVTVIPMLCYYFLKPLEKDTLVGRALNSLYKPYEILLRGIIKTRWLYPISILVLTVATGWTFKFVPNIFFPPNERGQFIVNYELPLGTDILETEKSVRNFEQWLIEENKDQVKSVSTWIGSSGPRWYLSLSTESSKPNYAFLSVLTHTEDPNDVAALIEKVRQYGDMQSVDARVTPSALETGPPVGDAIQIRLYGSDMDTLYRLRDEIATTLRSVEGCYDIRDDWGAWTKQVSIAPDPVRSARLGLSTQTITSAVGLQFSGQTATNYREDNSSIPVVLRSQEDFRESPDRLADLPIFDSSYGSIPLGQVADVAIEFQPGSILRENTERVMTIKAKVLGRYSSEALADIQPLIADLKASEKWSPGYRVEYGGEQAESGDAQKNLASAMPLSLSILALILIAQFNSLRRFAIICLTLPPMLIGVVPGLLLTGSSFGFMTLLGLIALLGIIVNNAILLIDEIDLQLKEIDSLKEAIITSCKSRLRPIVLTTCTTIVGLLTLAISGGGMWSSMAWAMIFGLAFATALTLLLCPSLFYLFFRRTYPEKEESKSIENKSETPAAEDDSTE
ncbi:efflux RND transporter permease subunit [Puniceicoccaceae bacterium K14]|nr:efflux RND transporter permease subunit [Puniceicoccaceae bacterium K14]